MRRWLPWLPWAEKGGAIHELGKQFKEGLITNNPVLVQVLGMCSTMAITTSFFNGLGMGLAVTIILTCSNVVISALRKIIPNKVRIACYIVVIAGFVTMVDLLLKGFVPRVVREPGPVHPPDRGELHHPGPRRDVRSKNGIVDSALDGLGMGLGFMLTLTIMGTIREILGSGTWMSGLDGLFPFLPEALPFRFCLSPSTPSPL